MNLEDSSISSGGRGFVSESSEGNLHQIHGIAIGSNDITKGSTSGQRKLWRPDVLSEAANTLSGKQVVVDHNNRSSRDVVGQITNARFEEDVGIIYEGEIDDEELASKIDRGWLDVSPRLIHSEEMEDLEGVEADVKVPQKIFRIDNLSIVSKGAAKSNEVNLGPHEELMSVEELQSAFDEEGVEEYQERVDELQKRSFSEYLYDNPEGAQGAAEGLGCSGFHEHTFEEGTWYMPCDSHDDFLANFSESEEELQDPYMPSEGDIVRWQANPDMMGRVSHNDTERSVVMVSLLDDSMEELGFTVTAGYEDLLPVNEASEELQEQDFTQGDFVSWGSRGGPVYGRIEDITTSETYDSEIDGDVSVSGEENDPAALITVYEDDENGWKPTDTQVGHKLSTLNNWEPNNLVNQSSAYVEELLLSEARTPEYEGTEESSWGDIPADTLSHYTENLDYDADTWDDLTEEQRSTIASHTLLGEASADTSEGGIFFPVVNASTGDLNRGALEAVRSGRGQSADIPSSTYESAFAIAGRLLNEEFDSDVETDFDEMEAELAEHDKEMSRVASQMASHSEMTKPEALKVMKSFAPGPQRYNMPLAKALSLAFDADREEMEKHMDELEKKFTENQERAVGDRSMRSVLSEALSDEEREDSSLLNEILE